MADAREIDSFNPAQDASSEDASPYTSLIGPSNRCAICLRENSTIRVSWDAVDGADYYRVYHDDLTHVACDFSEISGMLVFCEELAANVTGNDLRPHQPGQPGLGRRKLLLGS